MDKNEQVEKADKTPVEMVVDQLTGAAARKRELQGQIEAMSKELAAIERQIVYLNGYHKGLQDALTPEADKEVK